jgi:FkbM family methyltransferase
MFAEDLIYDIGANDGSDTDFYLGKGFRVVAVEANPDLCERARNRFRTAMDDGRLTILNVGITDAPGRQQFRINLEKDDWSSFVPRYSDRKMPATGAAAKIKLVDVDCVTLDTIMDEFGTPHYLKIDIEGHDDCAVRALESRREFPTYLSVEATVPNFGPRMAALGYDGFKLISQKWAYEHPLPQPPREGKFYQVKMRGTHSGPFGEETYGPWLTLADFEAEVQKHRTRDFEHSLHKAWGCPEAFFFTWSDFHARIGRQVKELRAATITDS